MQAIRKILGWLFGRVLLYALLVLAILAGAMAGPWIKAQWQDPARQLDRVRTVEQAVIAPLTSERAALQQRLGDAGAAARTQSLDELRAAVVRAEAARVEASQTQRSAGAQALSLASGDAAALLADGRRRLQIEYLDAEIAGLKAAIARIEQGSVLSVSALGAGEARLRCRAARLAHEEAENRWQVRATLNLYDAERRDALKARRDDLCLKSRIADQAQIAARQTYEAAQGWTQAQIPSVTGGLEAEIARARIAAEGSWRQQATLFAERIRMSDALRQAGIALALIIASPFLIRLFAYFILAPLAMRRPAVRVRVRSRKGLVIPASERSTTSVAIRLGAGEELLVRNGYLQTTSDTGRKSTQWLLDGRHPITSLVSGLNFLTRIRGEGEITTVSAVRDPFAEVAVLTLPNGVACVLQPRALAAVVQPIRRRLRVTSHWRLLSLNAWLTLQLRYLVFHGPSRLVLKGGRGVRVERAERGRILAQDQVIGFSTDLAYSVTRNETFWPYMLGREPLLRDRVAAGNGVLIVEEAPMAGRGSGERRGGLEGLIDAGLKVFGL
jgi:hypothetical protein